MPDLSASLWLGLSCGVLLSLGGGGLWMFLRRRISPSNLRIRELEDRLAHQADALRRAMDQAESDGKAKDEFLATMSHEIRTPFHAVLGMLNGLLGTPLNKEQREYVGAARQAATDLLRVLDDILDYSRIEAGVVNLVAEPFDLGAMAEDLVDLLTAEVREKPVELVLRHLPFQRRTYLGDAGRLRQVLLNLLGNAVKFTAKGHVLLDVRIVQAGLAHDLLEISVVDTGIGLEKGQEEAVFQRFHQVDSGNRRRFGGSGLGLAISRRLVELMGGTMGAEGDLGRGARFWVRLSLPVVREPASRLVRGGTWKRLSVLVLDDEQASLEVLGEVLSAWEVPHVMADGAPQLRARMEEARSHHFQRFRLVLLDESLASMEPWLRRQGLLAEALVVLMSSRCWAEAGKEGNLPVLRKPVRVWELQGLLDLASQHRPTQSLEPDTRARITQELKLPASHMPQRPPLAGCRILLVEDHPLNRQVGRMQLRDLGAEVLEAADGARGLSMALAFTVDAILMDLRMPEMDGFEATRAIRGSGSTVPIVATSAHLAPGERERCLAAGMNAILLKPFQRSELTAVLLPLLVQVPPEAAEAIAESALRESFQRDGVLDQDALGELVGMFQTLAPRSLAAASKAAADGDAVTLRRSIHDLGGASAYLHADRLTALCRSLEDLVVEVRLDEACAQLDAVARELERVLERVKTLSTQAGTAIGLS